jgi:hypothetical protein
MKKESGQKAVPIVPPAELEKMPTKQLVARLARLRYCEGSRAASNMTDEEIASVVGILFKNTAEWRAAHAEVKAALTTREQWEKISGSGSQQRNNPTGSQMTGHSNRLRRRGVV